MNSSSSKADLELIIVPNNQDMAPKYRAAQKHPHLHFPKGLRLNKWKFFIPSSPSCFALNTFDQQTRGIFVLPFDSPNMNRLWIWMISFKTLTCILRNDRSKIRMLFNGVYKDNSPTKASVILLLFLCACQS